MAKKKNPSAVIPIPDASEYNISKEREYNIIGQKIQFVRKEKGYSLDTFSKHLERYGLKASRSAINHWETGTTVPNAYQLMAISFALGIEEIDFYSENGKPLGLNREGIKKLDAYKADLIATGLYAPEEPKKANGIRFIEMPVSQLPASAGVGEFLSENSFEMVSFPASAVPKRANFGIRVSGDSMEPVYQDGAIVWVQECNTLNPGDVGIFVYDGEGYIKAYDERTADEDMQDAYLDSEGVLHSQPVLISYNEKYEPRLVSPELSFAIIGKVLN